MNIIIPIIINVSNLKKNITFNTTRSKIKLSIKSLSYIILLFVPVKFTSFPGEIHEKFLSRRNFKLPTSIAISIQIEFSS